MNSESVKRVLQPRLLMPKGKKSRFYEHFVAFHIISKTTTPAKLSYAYKFKHKRKKTLKNIKLSLVENRLVFKIRQKPPKIKTYIDNFSKVCQ